MVRVAWVRAAGATLTISASHLAAPGGPPVVAIRNAGAQIVSFSPTELHVIMPGIGAGAASVRVTTSDGTVTVAGVLVIAP